MVIYKYAIDHVEFEQIIVLPLKLKIVHFGKDPNGSFCIWAKVPAVPKNPNEGRKVRIVGTGEPFGDEWMHAGTLMDGPFMWHLLIEQDFYRGWALPA